MRGNAQHKTAWRGIPGFQELREYVYPDFFTPAFFDPGSLKFMRLSSVTSETALSDGWGIRILLTMIDALLNSMVQASCDISSCVIVNVRLGIWKYGCRVFKIRDIKKRVVLMSCI